MSYGEEEHERRGRRRLPHVGGFFLLTILITAVMITVFLGFAIVRIVPAGYKGVLLNWGDAVDVLDEGLHFITPIAQDVVLMNTQILVVSSTESTGSSDLQEVTTEVTVNYRLQVGFLLDIYRELRQDYEVRIIIPFLKDSLKSITPKFIAADLLSKRESVRLQFKELLKSRVAPYHIDVVEVSMTEFTYSDIFNAAIEAKVTAEQRALEALNKLKQIEYEARQQIIQAEAEANATVTRAVGNATATVIIANATAEAMQTIKVQLTPEYIEYLTVLGWDGKLPIYWAGGNGTMPFLLIPMAPTNSTITP